MSTKKGIKTIISLTATALTLFSLTACSSNKSSNSGNGSNKNATVASSSAKTVAKLPTDTGDDGTDLMNIAKNNGFTNIVKNDNYQDGTSFRINLSCGYIDISQDTAANSWIVNSQLTSTTSDSGFAALSEAESQVDPSLVGGGYYPTTSQLKQILSMITVDSNGNLVLKNGGTN